MLTYTLTFVKMIVFIAVPLTLRPLPQGARVLFDSVLLLQSRHLVHIQAVKGRADMEKEHAEDKGRDQEIERDAQFHYQRHAVGRAGGCEQQAVLHRQKSDNLRHRMFAGDHHEKAEHERGKSHGNGRTGNES